MATYQLGKGGVTPNFVSTVKGGFNKNKNLKVVVLQAFSRDKAQIKKTAEDLCVALTDDKMKVRSRIIGFTIILWKLRKRAK